MTELSYERVGSGARRFVLLHGFTQTRAAWRATAHRLVDRVPDTHCLLVDLPGHGESLDAPADPGTTSRLVASLGGSATYVGYSLGARVALRTAVDYPERVERLVMVSGTAGIEDSKEREQRAIDDYALAARIERIGIEAFLEEWLSQPMFRDLPAHLSGRTDRVLNTASGLSASLRGFGQGRQESLWLAIPGLRCPLLAVAGSHDVKYAEIARRLAALARDGTLRIVDGCGHSVVLERPELLADEIAYWMTRPSE